LKWWSRESVNTVPKAKSSKRRRGEREVFIRESLSSNEQASFDERLLLYNHFSSFTFFNLLKIKSPCIEIQGLRLRL
jgi:hypothetical protein